MDASKYVSTDFVDESVATAVESLLLVDANTLNQKRAISSCLIVLANAFPSDAKTIGRILALPKASPVATKVVQKVKFVSSNNTVQPSPTADCPTCPDNLKEKAIRTIDDVLAMGDKAFLLSVARDMGIKTHPSMKVETIAAKILDGTPDTYILDETTDNADEDNK